MFMHKSKKGFTIVELVIVIAVIAILAAVLIPTFSNLVKKANIANDTALAKNINTALTAYKATNAGDMEFEDVIAAARDAGYIISNLNPTTAGHYFVWEKSTNQILLVDGENAYKVIYANNEKYAPIGANWYFATSDKTAAAALKADSAIGGAQVKDMVNNVEAFTNALAQGGTQELYIDESVVLSDGKVLKVTDSSADITIELGNAKIATDTHLSETPIKAMAGKLTINGGELSGGGDVLNSNGTFGWAVSVAKDAKLILNNVKIITEVSGVTACSAGDGDAYIEVNNSTITAGKYVISMACGYKGGKAVLNNVTGVAAIPFFVSQGSAIEVNGGKFTSNGKNTDIGSNIIFRVQDRGSSITITGGTFVVGGVEKTFDELCKGGADAWKALCTSGVNVSIANGTVTITKG